MADEIIKVINELCNKFGIVIDWSAENVLPYAELMLQKFTNMMISQDIFYIVISIIGCVVFGIFIYNKSKILKDKEDIDDAECFIMSVFVVCFVVCIICMLIHIHNIIQVLTFPEIVFWNYINK